jgi:hypothetical protein
MISCKLIELAYQNKLLHASKNKLQVCENKMLPKATC